MTDLSIVDELTIHPSIDGRRGGECLSPHLLIINGFPIEIPFFKKGIVCIYFPSKLR